MAIEDIFKSQLASVLVVGFVAAVLPRALPGLKPSAKSVIKAGLTLITESEAEAEAEVIDKVIEAVMEGLIEGASAARDPAQTGLLAERKIERFKKRARIHADRWARNRHDSERRYRKYLARLRTKARHAEKRHGGRVGQAFCQLASYIDREIGTAGGSSDSHQSNIHQDET
jgi:hypothetical protein